jgi:hypothetical protein
MYPNPERDNRPEAVLGVKHPRAGWTLLGVHYVDAGTYKTSLWRRDGDSKVKVRVRWEQSGDDNPVCHPELQPDIIPSKNDRECKNVYTIGEFFEIFIPFIREAQSKGWKMDIADGAQILVALGLK